MIADLKRCARCGKIMHVSKFHKNASMSDGLQMHCKHCEKEAKQASEMKAKQRRELRRLAEDVIERRSDMDEIALAIRILKVY